LYDCIITLIMIIFSQSRHPSLVLLMGVSCNPATKRWGLISPFMARGALRSLLNAPSEQVALPWRQRAQLLLDAARGMLYLHKSQLVHGNLTSRAIMVLT
jgi:hypothetical protein